MCLILSLCLILESPCFAQGISELNIAGYLSQFHSQLQIDKFRPLHLRYLSYVPEDSAFRLLLDKGDAKDLNPANLEKTSKTLLKYFLIGLSLPNNSFWVNLRPDAEDNIIDDFLAKTDIGKIMLEADLQLKKDTALATSPETPEGKKYWDKLYKKAGELFGSENITIPTLTRPWIVPGEVIIGENAQSAYIYKATLKVMLEQDYLKGSAVYNFNDPRQKELNEYSSQLIRELIIPKLTREINTSKRYANLRQVYYSLIMAQWFKARFKGANNTYSLLIDRKGLSNLISKSGWVKSSYFKEYQKSFKNGEYNIKEPVYTASGQSIRSYFSGGMNLELPLSDFGHAGGVVSMVPISANLPTVDREKLAEATVRVDENIIEAAETAEELSVSNEVQAVPEIIRPPVKRLGFFNFHRLWPFIVCAAMILGVPGASFAATQPNFLRWSQYGFQWAYNNLTGKVYYLENNSDNLVTDNEWYFSNDKPAGRHPDAHQVILEPINELTPQQAERAAEIAIQPSPQTVLPPATPQPAPAPDYPASVPEPDHRNIPHVDQPASHGHNGILEWIANHPHEIVMSILGIAVLIGMVYILPKIISFLREKFAASKLERLTADITSARQTLDETSQKIEASKRELTEIERVLGARQSELQQLDEQLRSQESEIIRLSQQVDTFGSEVADLETKKQGLQQDLTFAQQEITRTQEALSELRSQIQSIESGEYAQKLEELVQREKAAQERLTRLQADIAQLAVEENSLKQQVGVLEAQKEEAERQRRELAELERQKQVVRDEIQQLETQRDALAESLVDVQQETQEALRRARDLEEQARIQARLSQETLTEEQRKLQEQLDAKRREVAEQISALGEQCRIAEERQRAALTQMEQTQDATREELNGLSLERDRIKKQVNDLTATLTALNSERESLLSVVRDLDNQRSHLEISMDQLRQQEAGLEAAAEASRRAEEVIDVQVERLAEEARDIPGATVGSLPRDATAVSEFRALPRAMLFDLDNTLSSTTTPIDSAMANKLIEILNQNRPIAIITAQSRQEIERNLIMLLRQAATTQNVSMECLRSLYIYPSFGSNGWNFDESGQLTPMGDYDYTRDTAFASRSPGDKDQLVKDIQYTTGISVVVGPIVKRGEDPGEAYIHDRGTSFTLGNVPRRDRQALAEKLRREFTSGDILVGGSGTIHIVPKNVNKARAVAHFRGILDRIYHGEIVNSDILIVGDDFRRPDAFRGGLDRDLVLEGANNYCVGGTEQEELPPGVKSYTEGGSEWRRTLHLLSRYPASGLPNYTGAGDTSIHFALDVANNMIMDREFTRAQKLLQELITDLTIVQQTQNIEPLMDKWDARYPPGGVDLLFVDAPLAISAAQELLGQIRLPVGNSPIPNQGLSTTGGIDFRSLPIVTQAIGNLSLNIGGPLQIKSNNINLKGEWREIEKLLNIGVIPSTERIKEYIQASYLKGQPFKDKDKILTCISDILRLEEERCSVTDPILKDILIVFESGRRDGELKQIFLGKALALAGK